jgi:hypothetical protein
MTNIIHSDFATFAEAMASAFSTIEKNQAWDLMPSLFPDLLTEGHRCTLLDSLTQEYKLRRRQSRRSTAKAMTLIV